MENGKPWKWNNPNGGKNVPPLAQTPLEKKEAKRKKMGPKKMVPGAKCFGELRGPNKEETKRNLK